MSKTKRAYKYWFSPTDEQKRLLAQTFVCCRFVYNWGLSTRKTAFFQQGQKKSSKNREKARRKVARVHTRIQDRRSDYQHKHSTRIVHENRVICVESLAVKNHRLAKAISDMEWDEFVRQLE